MKHSYYSSPIGDVNEDSIYVPAGENDPRLYLVADGLGGHNNGKAASTIAARCVAEYIHQSDKENPIAMMRTAAAFANAIVYEMSDKRGPYHGMGTTLSYVYIDDTGFYTANIGDSRVYLYDRTSLTRITFDHSYVAELVKAGQITEAEAQRNIRRNLITRSVGTKKAVDADLFESTWQTGDIILICSDGLYTGASDDEIYSILRNVSDLDDACMELVRAARVGGSNDDITVILIQNEGD